jgi:hypothetical protein
MMNERIRELMAGAVTFYLDPDSNAYEAQVSPEDLELFAELIVRECATLAYDGPGGILDHFGVKEE